MSCQNVLWTLVLLPSLVIAPRADGNDKEKYLGWEQKWGARQAYSWDQDDLLVRYNRVEGLFLGGQEPLSYHSDQGLVSYGHLGYSFGTREWQYQIGIEEFFFHGSPQKLFSIGGELHDATTSQDTWLLDAEINSLYSALYRRDFFDYYRHRGWSVYVIHNFAGIVHLTGSWSQDEFFSQDSQIEGWIPVNWIPVNWIPVFNKLARKTFRPNPAVDEGKASSLRLNIQVDNRDRQRWSGREWLINSMIEQGGSRLGGDFAFRRALFEVGHRLFDQRGGEVDLYLRLGRSSGELPRQYLYYLGGYSTLRGYPYKAFSGDRMVLLNVEYWHDDIGVLFDMGAAWFSSKGAQWALERGAMEPDKRARFKRSLGFAVRDEGFQIGLARPLDAKKKDWHYFACYSRIF